MEINGNKGTLLCILLVIQPHRRTIISGDFRRTAFWSHVHREFIFRTHRVKKKTRNLSLESAVLLIVVTVVLLQGRFLM